MFTLAIVIKKEEGRRKKGGEWGVGSGEWGVGEGRE
jgi:hypothetical protein